LPYQYQRTPFDPSRGQVKIRQNCHDWGARDLSFDGMPWNEPVYAVEAGTIVSLNRNFNCYSNEPDPNYPGLLKPKWRTDDNSQDCWAHFIVVQGKDRYFTEYAHVMPAPGITVGTVVRAGTWIGNVDSSGPTQGPHVHFARWIPQLNYAPNPNAFPVDARYRGDYIDWNRNGTCDWTMVGVDATGWVQQNEKWYYYVNGTGQTGQTGTYRWAYDSSDNRSYEFDSNGAWTGWYYQWSDRKYYFKTRNGFGPLATSTTIGSLQLGPDGACLNCR